MTRVGGTTARSAEGRTEPGTVRARELAVQDRALRKGVRAVLLTVSIAALAVALPASLIADVDDAPRSDAWVITLGIMVWAGIRLSLLAVAGIPRMFDFFFWLFAYIFLGIAPTAQIRTGLTSTTTPDVDPGLDVPTAGVVVLGLVCYEVARLIVVVREGHTDRLPPGIRPVSRLRTGALFAVALTLSAYVVSQLGVTIFEGSREAATAARAAAWPDPAVRSILYAGGVYPMAVAVGAAAQCVRQAATRLERLLWTAAAVGGAVVLLLIVNPVTSARYTFGTIAFALAVFLGALATRVRARVTMLAVLLGFLVLFPVADTFRRAGGGTTTRSGFFAEYLSNPDYDAFWQIANALSYWLEGLVVPFSQFLGNVLFWVPRTLWAEKPTDTGIVLAQYRGYAVDNLSAPLWAEALVNGGLVAVIVCFAACGVGLRVMDTRIVPALRQGGVWAIVGAILPVFTTILLRGSLLQATGALVLTIAAILVVRGAAQPAADRFPVRADPLPLTRPASPPG